MAIGLMTIIKVGSTTIQLAAAAMDISERIDTATSIQFGKAEIEVDATEEKITIKFSGTSFSLNHDAMMEGITHSVEEDAQGNTTLKALWKWNLKVQEDAGGWTDQLTFSGWVKHLWQCHPTDVPTNERLDFSMLVSANNTDRISTGGTNTWELNIPGNDVGLSVNHPNVHKDEIVKESIVSTISSGYGQDDFTSYTFTLVAEHKEIPQKDKVTETETETG